MYKLRLFREIISRCFLYFSQRVTGQPRLNHVQQCTVYTLGKMSKHSSEESKQQCRSVKADHFVALDECISFPRDNVKTDIT